MNESILDSVKDFLDIPVEESETYFDAQLIIHINTFLRRLNQIGVGVENFSITSNAQKWSDFLLNEDKYKQAKEYVFLRTKQIFDPPTNSSASKAYDDVIKELETLMYWDADNELED